MMHALHSDVLDAPIGTIIDIGGGNGDVFKMMAQENLIRKDKQQPLLPSSIISDDIGLRIWSELTHAPEYYQTRVEIELLERYGSEIVKEIPSQCTLIDLGSGDLRKVKPLLDALEKAQKEVDYFALDLSEDSLERGMQLLTPLYHFVHCFGLWGQFEDGRAWSKGVKGPKWFLSLGSIFGNAPFDEAVAGLSKWRSVMRPEDRMLLAMDANTDKDIVWNSYHDSQGLYDRFVRNGLRRSNVLFGHSWYRDEDWEITGRLQEKPVMHQSIVRAVVDISHEPLGIHFAAGDEIHCGGAYKYGPGMMNQIFVGAGLKEISRWEAPSSPIYEYLLVVDSKTNS